MQVDSKPYDGYLLPEGNLGSTTCVPYELCYGKTWSVTIEYPIRLNILFCITTLTCCIYESEEVVAECLHFLKKELTEFSKGGCSEDDEDDLDTEKENSRLRAFAIIGKRPGML
jgi:hypothetical protein